MRGVYLRRSRWWIRYRFDGKLIRKPIGKDRQLAEAAMAEIRLEITRGRHEERARDERITFEEMADEYLELKETEECQWACKNDPLRASKNYPPVHF